MYALVVNVFPCISNFLSFLKLYADQRVSFLKYWVTLLFTVKIHKNFLPQEAEIEAEKLKSNIEKEEKRKQTKLQKNRMNKKLGKQQKSKDFGESQKPKSWQKPSESVPNKKIVSLWS